jgi:hypothetical protein
MCLQIIISYVKTLKNLFIRAGGMAQVIGHLTSKNKALNSNPEKTNKQTTSFIFEYNLMPQV